MAPAREAGQRRHALAAGAGWSRAVLLDSVEWPDGFFSSEHRTADELRDLREAAEEFAKGLAASRRSRRAPPFR
jgi:hypothetical protein